MISLPCEFIFSRLNPNLLQCKYCGFIIQSRDRNKKFNCRNSRRMIDPETTKLTKVSEETINIKSNPVHEHRKPCSQNTIDSRLKICFDCPFYENNTCLKCGCSLSRNRVFMNKLYWADSSCPIGKWGPVDDDE